MRFARDLAHTLVLLFGNLDRSIPTPVLVILIFWLCITFASFGLFRAVQRNGDRRSVRLCAVDFRCALFDP